MDPSLIDPSLSGITAYDSSNPSITAAKKIYTELTLSGIPGSYTGLMSIQTAAEAISAVIAQSNATDVVQHAKGLRRLAQAMHDLEDFLGGEQGAQIVLGRLKSCVPAALKIYRQHLLPVLKQCRDQGVWPDPNVLFALSVYASACAQTVSKEMRDRATQWNWAAA